MNKKVLIVFIISLLVIITLSGCGGSSGGDNQTPTQPAGSLGLTINTDKLQKGFLGIGPDPSITSYEISGAGPSGSSYHQTFNASTAPIVIEGIKPGDWSIMANAKNPAGIVLGTGVTTVTTGTGTNNASVIVAASIGQGGLTVTLTWPAASVSQPVVTGTLTGEGQPTVNVPFTVNAGQLQAVGQLTGLEAGCYSLALQLKDGNTFVSGAVVIVWIVAGQTSTGTIQAYVNSLGGISIGVTPIMNGPVMIGFTGNPSQLTYGTNMNVTASISPSGGSNIWYCNGNTLSGNTGNTLNNFGNNLPVGHYRVDLFVSRGTTISSNAFEFDVVLP